MFAFLPGDYQGSLITVFENGKAARVGLESYNTKSNRKKLTGAYSDKAPAIGFFIVQGEEREITMFSTANRALTISTELIPEKTTRSTQGVQVMVLRGKHKITRVVPTDDSIFHDPKRYRFRAIPSIGAILKDEDLPNEQLTL